MRGRKTKLDERLHADYQLVPVVIAGLAPAIHPSSKKMDPRKPAGDERYD
jgi:hypothetical protein